MATIYRFTKGESCYDESGQEAPAFTRQLYPGVEVCSFCGEPTASGWWRGHQSISLCRRCAIEDLPRLLADAIAGERADAPNVVGNLQRAWEQAESRFWQAACVAIVQAAKRAKERCGQ
jgi:hypothetical protein